MRVTSPIRFLLSAGVAATVLAGVAVSRASADAPASAAPAALSAAQADDAGERVMNARCQDCHDLRVIQTQAMNAEGWQKTIEAMIEKGATVPKTDMPVLVEYLARHHGPVPDGPGKAILLNICTMCHDLGRIRLGRRSAEEWEETLGAMLNEGAPLSEEQFPIIHAYLSRNFGID